MFLAQAGRADAGPRAENPGRGQKIRTAGRKRQEIRTRGQKIMNAGRKRQEMQSRGQNIQDRGQKKAEIPAGNSKSRGQEKARKLQTYYLLEKTLHVRGQEILAAGRKS